MNRGFLCISAAACLCSLTLSLSADYQKNLDQAKKFKYEKKYEQAIARFKAAAMEAEKLDSKAFAYFEAASMARAMKRYDEAIKICEMIIAIPDVLTDQAVQACVTAADNYRLMREFDKAVLALKRIETIPYVAPRHKMTMYLQIASIYSSLQNHKERENALLAAVKFDPVVDEIDVRTMVNTYNDLINLQLNMGKVNDAIRSMEALINLPGIDPQSMTSALTRNAGLEMRLGKTENAIQLYKKAVAMEGATLDQVANLHATLAELYLTLGNVEEAVKEANAINYYELEKTNPHLLKKIIYSKSEILAKCGKYEEAKGLLEDIMNMAKGASPELAANCRFRMICAIRQQKIKEGIAEIETILAANQEKINATDMAWVRDMINSVLEAGELVKLIPEYEKIIEIPNLDPMKKFEMLMKIANLLVRVGRLQESYPYYERALTLEKLPSSRAFWGGRNYVAALNASGDFKKMDEVAALISKISCDSIRIELMRYLYTVNRDTINGYTVFDFTESRVSKLPRMVKLFESVGDLEKIGGFDDGKAELYNRYADLLLKSGRPEEAIENYKKSIASASPKWYMKRNVEKELDKLISKKH